MKSAVRYKLRPRRAENGLNAATAVLPAYSAHNPPSRVRASAGASAGLWLGADVGPGRRTSRDAPVSQSSSFHSSPCLRIVSSLIFRWASITDDRITVCRVENDSCRFPQLDSRFTDSAFDIRQSGPNSACVFLVDGRVRRLGISVRITTQLISTPGQAFRSGQNATIVLWRDPSPFRTRSCERLSERWSAGSM